MERSINLLPEKRKNAIRIDRLNRFVLKMGVIVIFSILLLILFLFSNLFIIGIYKKINQDEAGRTEKGGIDKVIKETKSEIDRSFNETNQAVGEIEKRVSYWVYFNEINGILPEDIFYSEIEMKADQIKLRGLAKNREDLVKFKNSLENSEIFKKVEMPISNFTSQKNVNFEINLVTGKK